MKFRAWRWLVGISVALALALIPATPQADTDLWSLLRQGGLVILMRHTTTDPASGDPPGVRLGDCSTQRNLSDTGRAEARKIGEVFRSHNIPIGRVLSSPYCRCQETAQLAFGRVDANPGSDAYLNLPEKADQRQKAIQLLRTVLATPLPKGDNLVLVTHGNNIRPVTNAQPEMGEFFVIAADGKGGFRILGRIAPADLH